MPLSFDPRGKLYFLIFIFLFCCHSLRLWWSQVVKIFRLTTPRFLLSQNSSVSTSHIQLLLCQMYDFHHLSSIPVMAAVAVRKKVVSIGHFSPSFYLQTLHFFLFVVSNQEQLYVLIAEKIRMSQMSWNAQNQYQTTYLFQKHKRLS